MATASRPSDPSLKRPSVSPELETRLREQPYSIRFFQAVRLLERMFPDRKPVGRFVNPSEEIAHFGANASLSFPASEIQSLEWQEEQPHNITVNFFGLAGPISVLPHCYTSLIMERMRAGDTTLKNFLDIFNHRFLSLFYQAWEKYRFAIPYERGELDRFSGLLLDLIGVGTKGLENRQDVDDEALLYFAGILGQRPHSAKALELILEEYFEVPVEVEQLLGGWFPLDPDTECCLGERESPSEQLGEGAVAGNEVWDQGARARIKLGPLSLSQYLDFLPSGSAFRPLRSLTRFFSNDEIDFEVQLVLRRDQVPVCELGSESHESPRLGWVSWARSAPMTRDPEDTILAL